jgi:hypothetical protein
MRALVASERLAGMVNAPVRGCHGAMASFIGAVFWVFIVRSLCCSGAKWITLSEFGSAFCRHLGFDRSLGFPDDVECRPQCLLLLMRGGQFRVVKLKP